MGSVGYGGLATVCSGDVLESEEIKVECSLIEWDCSVVRLVRTNPCSDGSGRQNWYGAKLTPLTSLHPRRQDCT